MAEHSMCQPAAPHPRATARPARRAWRVSRGRSRGSCLAESTSTRSPARRSSRDLPEKLAVAGELAHRVIDVAVGSLIGQAPGLERVDEAEHFGDVVGGPGSKSGRSTPRASASSCMQAMKRLVRSRMVSPFRWPA